MQTYFVSNVDDWSPPRLFYVYVRIYIHMIIGQTAHFIGSANSTLCSMVPRLLTHDIG